MYGYRPRFTVSVPCSEVVLRITIDLGCFTGRFEHAEEALGLESEVGHREVRNTKSKVSDFSHYITDDRPSIRLCHTIHHQNVVTVATSCIPSCEPSQVVILTKPSYKCAVFTAATIHFGRTHARRRKGIISRKVLMWFGALNMPVTVTTRVTAPRAEPRFQHYVR